MSERWKYQIKSGGLWGVFMILFMSLYELKEKSFSEQLTNPNFFIRAFFYLITGIFLLGYYNWKEKIKRENSENK